MNILIVGAGKNGRGAMAKGLAELIAELEPTWIVRFYRSMGPDGQAYQFTQLVDWCDIMVLAIRTDDSGQAARDYMSFALLKGKLVVTCEKGALSEFFPLFTNHLHRIGYSAVAGGGSMITDLFNKVKRIRRIVGVVNGSCNNISSLVEEDEELDIAVEQTREAGFTDPYGKSIHATVNGELDDAARKGVVLHNLAFPNKAISFSQLSRMVFSEDGVYHLFSKRKGQDYAKRLIVQIFPYDLPKSHQIYMGNPCFWHRTETHYIAGSFIDPTWVFPMIPRRAQNCLLIQDEDGKSEFKYGPGAGIRETSLAMLADMRRLLNSR